MHLPGNDKLEFRISPMFRNVALGLMGLGLLLIAYQIIAPWHGSHPHAEGHGYSNPRLFMSMNLALLVGIPVALGGVFFTALHHLSGAAWSTTVRRLSESFFWSLPVLLVFLAVVLFGMKDVFHHWATYVPGSEPKDALLEVKAAYLNQTSFIIRNIVIFLIWIGFGFLFWKTSVKQDADGEFKHTSLLVKLSAGFMVVFGLTLSVSSWDLGMSVEPHWFSTMWAVYFFTGLGLSVFAAMILWIWYLKRAGYVAESVNTEHIHDLGKWLWGFTAGWAYIALGSQFLLIWYAHIPEETIFYHVRMYNDDMSYNAWGFMSLVIVMLRWILPFFLLIKREWKRNLNWLAINAVVVLVGQVLDMYWVLYPTLDGGHFIWPSIQELGPLLLLIGAFMLSTAWGLSRAKLIPVKDPRLEECLHSHH